MSAEDVSWWANWILVGALLVGVAATYAIVVSGNIKEANLKRELKEKDDALEIYKADAGEKISAANAAGESAKADAAKLSVEAERLKADNLALQKLIQPREFPTPVELGVLPNVVVPGAPYFNFITKYKDTPVVIQHVNDFEAETLANDMAATLAGFGWRPEIVTEAQTGIPSRFIQKGVEVTFPKTGKYGDAARDLAGAFSNVGLTGPMIDGYPSELHASGYATKSDGSSVMKSYPSFDPPRDTVVVLIGMKPYPSKKGRPVRGFIKPLEPSAGATPK